ncbi:MAG: DUF4178 domain-containing protein [Desulfobacula sp. GWF2_41_7]|nr:MAG: DUF4178 domain-containing protein [Desulfobacula sp. GWF2_41_7]
MLDTATQKSFRERFSAIRTLSGQALVTGPGKPALTLKDAGKNSFFDYMGKTYLVKDLSRYEETSDDFKKKKGYFITELTCLCLETGETVYFEWEFDDVLKVCMTLERFSFRNLKDDEGGPIDEDDLDEIADTKDTVVVNGERFFYEDDWASLYARDGKEEKVYMYEFENEGGTLFLTIEEWSSDGREEYRIYTSSPVDPKDMTLISKGEA